MGNWELYPNGCRCIYHGYIFLHEDEKSEGSGDEVDYFCSQSMESGDMSEPGYESDESEAEYKDSERRKRKQRRKPSSESSSSVFSDLIPCKQTISSRKCTKDESPNIEKKTQYRPSAEPIASTSKATYGGRTSKVMVESSSNEEDVPIRRQDSTLGVLGSVSSVTDVFGKYMQYKLIFIFGMSDSTLGSILPRSSSSFVLG